MGTSAACASRITRFVADKRKRPSSLAPSPSDGQPSSSGGPLGSPSILNLIIPGMLFGIPLIIILAILAAQLGIGAS